MTDFPFCCIVSSAEIGAPPCYDATLDRQKRTPNSEKEPMSLVPMYPDSDDNSGNPSPNSGAEAANDDLSDLGLEALDQNFDEDHTNQVRARACR